jgi:iron-sulfur cluster repair protein YtfE (RIC family)
MTSDTDSGSAASSADTINTFLSADHERLTELWEGTLAAVDAEEFNNVHSRAAAFIAGLRRHIGMEEQILFPAIEQKTGERDFGPTWAMRQEHRQIEHALDRLRSLLTVEERWTAIQAIEGQEVDLTALLRSHDAKEEAVLYPMADQILGAAEAKELVARMKTEVDSPRKDSAS